LVTFEAKGALRAGVLLPGSDGVVDARAAGDKIEAGAWADSVRGIIEQDLSTRTSLADAAAGLAAEATSLGDVKLRAPIPDPTKVICIGLNYGDHVEEAKRVDKAPNEASPVPILFAKFASSLIGHEADVVTPPGSEKMDWEAELAVVIGRQASSVSLAQALDHVGGYASFNDVSARDLQLATPQWTAGKAFDTSGPFGPFLKTADEVPDPQTLGVKARLNGETMQDGNTVDMLFPVARLIEFISSLITLVPGDVIATGTPAGVGVGRQPPVFMQPGDVIEVEVEGLGTLRNKIVKA
jgi:2-keto-4-pentenoate hydratase/2-oxohepta-3-ene-1,7-dioic acid hydratase in catechol pathway